MTTTLREAILNILSELGEASIGSFFPEKYPVGRFWRRLGNGSKRPTRQTFSVLLSRLQREGLIERRGVNRFAFWRITSKGKQYLAEQATLPKVLKRDGIRRLVIFDIPEQEKKKRDTLRYELATMGYQQLQKSVWMGDFPLSMDLLELLDALDLKKHVHIFSVNQTGTLNDKP